MFFSFCLFAFFSARYHICDNWDSAKTKHFNRLVLSSFLSRQYSASNIWCHLWLENQKPLKFLPVWESAKEKMVTASQEENWESLSNGPATDPGLIQTHHNYRPDFSDQIFRVSVIYEHIYWCLSDGPYRWLSSWNISSQIKLGDASLLLGLFLRLCFTVDLSSCVHV